MKMNSYFAWIEVNGKVKRELGIYFTLGKNEAKIHAQSAAILMGIDYKLVKVAEIKDDK